MANPLLSGIKSTLEAGQVSQLLTAYKYAKNPQELMNNPQLKQVLALYKGDAKTAFYELCKQRGIDPESILNQLR